MAWHYEGNDPGEWSTPLSFANGFKQAGHDVDYFGFNPKVCDLSLLISQANLYDLIFICLAGPSDTFDSELIRLKNNTTTKIFMEFGDDIPSSNFFRIRKHYVDGIFTLDKRCHNQYLSEGLPSHWMPVFCDDRIFYKKDNPNRKNICVTTCLNRPLLNEFKNIFQDRFIYQNVWQNDNTDFYNSGTFTYQYARYGELTRRIMEAGGCGNAIITNRIDSKTGIYDLFPEDECIAYFSTEEEAYRQMHKLYDDDEYRNTLADNLYTKIRKNHLIFHRIQQILKVYNDI